MAGWATWGTVTAPVTGTQTHVTKRTYDPNRNLIDSTDANGKVTHRIYDSAYQLTILQRPDTSEQRTGYDLNGNITSQQDGAHQTNGTPPPIFAMSYTFDPLDHRATSNDSKNPSTAYKYDAIGNLTTVTDALGKVTSRTFDAANQLTRLTYNDAATPNAGFTYDALGHRLSMSDGTGQTTYTFDSLNHIQSTTNGAGATLTYTSDLKGLITDVLYPGQSNTVHRTFDEAGRLTSVRDFLAAPNTMGFGYDANSNLTTITYPGTGHVATFGPYDAANQLPAINDASASFSSTYIRDGQGQVTADSAAGATYGPYDSMNRLINVNGAAVYVYDAADQIKKSPTISSFSYDSASQLSSSVATAGTSSYTFDAKGNRTQTAAPGSTTNYGYDQANRFVSYNQGAATYAYNGDGLRMTKTVAGTTSQQTWDVAAALPQLVQDAGVNYITGPHGMPLEQVAGTTASFFHVDQLGSVRSITSATGAVLQSYSYDPYGIRTSGAPTFSNPFQFAGQYLDAETGLYYLRNRFYEPSTGQFISRDPLVGVTRAPYAYVGDNPLNATDPSGLCIEDACIGEATGVIIIGVVLIGLVAANAVMQSTGQNAIDYGSAARDLVGGVDSASAAVARAAQSTWQGLGTVGSACEQGWNLLYSSGGRLRGRESKRSGDEVVKRIGAQLGLGDEGQQILHREISGQNYTPGEIEEIAREIKAKYPNK